MGVLEEASLMTTDGLKASWLTYLLPIAFSQKFCRQHTESAEADSSPTHIRLFGTSEFCSFNGVAAAQLHACKRNQEAPVEHL